jgi:hypothetical protein
MMERKFGLKRGEEIVEVQNLHHLKRSPPINLPGEVPPVLVALDRKDPEGKPVAIEIKLPAGVESPLVLIIPDAKHPTGVKPFVIEDNTNRFKWGSIRFMNATSKPVMTKVDNKVAEVAPGWAPVDVDPQGDVRNMSVVSAYKDNPTQLLYSAVWEHNPDVRELVIIVPNPNANVASLDFKVIPENRKILEMEANEKKEKEQ